MTDDEMTAPLSRFTDTNYNLVALKLQSGRMSALPVVIFAGKQGMKGFMHRKMEGMGYV